MLLLVIALQFLSCIHSFTYPRHSYNHDPSIKSFNNNIHLCSQQDDNDTNPSTTDNGIRLNKVFKATHSRREADKLIESGRVSINGISITTKGGMKVIPYQDIITLDGQIVHGWEQMNAIQNINQHQETVDNQVDNRSSSLNTKSFEYVKYFKPLGVTCTTDQRIRHNIIDAIQSDGYNPRHRVYPVGRLDKETSGLILLTSDGRVVNSVLRGERKQPKVYKVMVNGRLQDSDLQKLRDGIVITTIAQRKGKSIEENTLVAKTKQCKVKRLGPSAVEMTLVEGRNRQIRKMMEGIGYKVVKLHRVEFMGIRLSGLRGPGDWAYLDEDEMKLIEDVLVKGNE